MYLGQKIVLEWLPWGATRGTAGDRDSPGYYLPAWTTAVLNSTSRVERFKLILSLKISDWDITISISNSRSWHSNQPYTPKSFILILSSIELLLLHQLLILSSDCWSDSSDWRTLRAHRRVWHLRKRKVNVQQLSRCQKKLCI